MTSIERVQGRPRLRGARPRAAREFAIDCGALRRVIGRRTIARDKAGLPQAYWGGRCDEVVEQTIADLTDFYRALPVWDLIPLWKMAQVPPRGYHPPKPRQVAEGVWEDDAGRVWRYTPVANEIVIVRDPVADARQWTLEDFPLDAEVGPEDESIYEAYDAILPTLPEDAYILGPFPMANEQVLLGGYERGMVEIALHPEVVERAVQAGIECARREREHGQARGAHGVINGADWGHSTGTFVSPTTFRRLFAPAVRFNVAQAHAAGLDFFQHCCGDFRPIIDQLAEAGIDCMQSLQPSAEMTPVNHVGKIYHVMARRIVDRLLAEVDGLTDATCTMVSRIGAPVTEPQGVLIEVRGIDASAAEPAARDITAAVLNGWDGIRDAIVAGECELF